ncbi:MAG: hypothetical protein HY720_09330 [Planctomycetes bacterium]|nr:hypothetical protein [Planctomycetota bacterium]
MKKWLLIALVAAVPLTLVAVAGTLYWEEYHETRVVTIASGTPGATYHKMAQGFRRSFARDEERLRVRLVEYGYDEGGAPTQDPKPSEGAFQNLDLLERGRIDVGFVQGGLPRKPGIIFLLNFYRASVQIVARRGLVNREGKAITEIEELDDWDEFKKTQRLSIGAPGSGTRLLAIKILKFYQKNVVRDPAAADDPKRYYYPHIKTLGFQDSLLALKLPPDDPNAIDVAFFVSGTGTVDQIKKLLYLTDEKGDLVGLPDEEGKRPRIELDPVLRLEEHLGIVPDLDVVPAHDASDVGKTRPRYRFLEVRRNTGLSIAYPYLAVFSIPKGTYSSEHSFPDHDIPTVTVSEMLCASEARNLDWVTVNLLVAAIWQKKSLVEDVPQLAGVTEEEARRSTEYEPHPGAAGFFEKKEYVPWALILAGTSAVISVLGTLTKVRTWYYRWRMLREMAWAYRLEDRIPAAPAVELAEWLTRLERAHEVLTDDFIKVRVGVGQGVGIVLERVRLLRDRIRNRLKEISAAGGGPHGH